VRRIARAERRRRRQRRGIMHDVSARCALLLAALSCAALAGCGGSGAGESAGSGRPDAARGEHAALVLLAPLRDEAVPARARAKRVHARLDVAGLASPGAHVVITGAGCTARCAAAATADASGNWTAPLPMSLPKGAVIASVTASYANPIAGDLPARVSAPLALAGDGSTLAQAGTSATTTPADGTPATENEGPSAPDGGAASSFPVGLGGAAHALTLIGDSLSVEQPPLLEGALPGWSISSSARVGRPLAEGMGILADTDLPANGVLAMGLFTNDDPSHTDELAAAVADSLQRVGPRGCAIWATIAAPPRGGQSFEAANRMLNVMATREPRLRIVPWAEATSQQPSLLSGDGVHPVPAGAQLRAALFAQAARSCG
jgi:hypothetical protein